MIAHSQRGKNSRVFVVRILSTQVIYMLSRDIYLISSPNILSRLPYTIIRHTKITLELTEINHCRHE